MKEAVVQVPAHIASAFTEVVGEKRAATAMGAIQSAGEAWETLLEQFDNDEFEEMLQFSKTLSHGELFRALTYGLAKYLKLKDES